MSPYVLESLSLLMMKLYAVLLSLAAFTVAGAAWAKVEVWRQEGSAAFAKYHRDRVVISDRGKVLPGPGPGADRPARGRAGMGSGAPADGTVYAATGDGGKVFRQATKEGAPWTVALDASDTQALSLAATPQGKVFVGTGPSGQVIDVTDPQHPASRPDPKVQYIWDLAADAEGNLVAATGPTGQLWKRSRDGKWTLVFDSKATHLLCVAVAADGAIYAGSDGEGLIYRVGKDGKVSVIYDAPQSEVRTLLLAPDGALYAGTAAEAGGSGGGRPPGMITQEVEDRSGAPPEPMPAAETGAQQKKSLASPANPAGPCPAVHQIGRSQASGGWLRGAQAGYPGRQRRLQDRQRWRCPRGLQGPDPGLRAGLAG